MPVFRPKQSDRFGGDVVLAAGDVDLERPRLAERDHARIEPVDQRAQGQEIQLARILANRSELLIDCYPIGRDDEMDLAGSRSPASRLTRRH